MSKLSTLGRRWMKDPAFRDEYETLGKEFALVASITIHNVDDELKARLRVRAAENGRSMGEEAREILRAALSAERPPQRGLAAAIRARVAPFGGVELETPPREPIREPPHFGKPTKRPV